MSIPIEQVRHIANLAKLKISDEGADTLSTKLGGILNLINDMQATDTDNIEPMSHPIEQNQLLRKDEAVANNQRETLQEIAPSVEDAHYLVPKVIE